MTLRYSPAALRDLDQMWDEVYAASKDLDVTDRYVNGMMDALDARQAYPRSGSPLTYNGEPTGLYYQVYKEYLAFYRVTDSAMEVARILYSGRDYMRILFPR